MANRVTDLDIIEINTLYLEYHNKAEVARQTGFSASTVTKYIIPNFKPVDDTVKAQQWLELPLNTEIFNVRNWNYLLILSEDEQEDMEILRKEVLL